MRMYYKKGGKVNKKSMSCNKPKRTPSHPKKKFMVKACEDGKRENHPLRRQEHEDQEEPAGAAQVFPCETQVRLQAAKQDVCSLLVL